MALETHMKLSVTEPDFFLKKKKINLPKKGKMNFIYLQILSQIF